MAFVVKNRVWETTATTGTGTLTLDGAKETNFLTFSVGIGNGNTTYYFIIYGSGFEYGIGTVAAGTLARTTVIGNHLGTTDHIDLPSGEKDVFCGMPAEKAAFIDQENRFTEDQFLEGSKLYLDAGEINYFVSREATVAQFFLNGSEILRLDDGSNFRRLSVYSSYSGGAEHPRISMYRNAQLPANTKLGELQWDTKDDAGSGGNRRSFAKIQGWATTVTSGAEDGKLDIGVLINGTMTIIAKFMSTFILFEQPFAVSSAKTSVPSLTAVGFEVTPAGAGGFTADAATPLVVNRLTDDGTLISLRQNSIEEGAISVSGTTIAYGTFTGGHWTEWDKTKGRVRRDEERPGLVLIATDEAYHEDKTRLPKVALSTKARDPRVYGIFGHRELVRDDSRQVIGTRIMTHSLGVGEVLVTGPVKNGDLLCSSDEPGVAMAQGDDLVRNYTLGKATITDERTDVRLVRCVLMAG